MNKIELEFLLKSKLAEKGLNITKFAEHLGVTPQNISQRVKKGTFGYLEICEIADWLGYTIKWEKKIGV